jgi:hypothetical protein
LFGAGTAGMPTHITVAGVYSKALELYEEFVNLKQWIKSVPKGANMASDGESKGSNDSGSSDKHSPQFPDLTQKKLEISKKVEAGLMSAEEAKKARRRIDKEKKARRGKQDKSSDSSKDSSYNAASPPEKSKQPRSAPGKPRIREFVVDGIKVHGDTTPPAQADLFKPRSFTKVDGSGTIELYWCKLHGFNGMWQNHQCKDCPLLRTGGQGSGNMASNTPPNRPNEHATPAMSGGLSWADQYRRREGGRD